MKNIETDRFILRKINLGDVVNVFNILNNPKVIENLNMKIPKNVNDVETLLKEYLDELEIGNKYPFAIISKKDNKFIGVFLIKLDLYDEDCYEFTVYIDESEWGKGIYTEILPYMADFAFNVIGTKNFRGFVMEKNKASSRVLEKCGFKLEKIFEVEGLEGKILSFLMEKK
jgi:RimJ/RimL family protein N-acetyltransferase